MRVLLTVGLWVAAAFLFVMIRAVLPAEEVQLRLLLQAVVLVGLLAGIAKIWAKKPKDHL